MISFVDVDIDGDDDDDEDDDGDDDDSEGDGDVDVIERHFKLISHVFFSSILKTKEKKKRKEID